MRLPKDNLAPHAITGCDNQVQQSSATNYFYSAPCVIFADLVALGLVLKNQDGFFRRPKDEYWRHRVIRGRVGRVSGGVSSVFFAGRATVAYGQLRSRTASRIGPKKC